MLHELLAIGACVHVSTFAAAHAGDSAGAGVLQVAAQRGNYEVVQALLVADANAEEEITKTPKQYTYVEVNSSASLRTGRSSTLKSKFKDVISLKRCVVWVLMRFDEEKKSLSTRKEKGKRKM